MTIISKQNAEHYKWGEEYDGWHFVKSKALSVIQERVPPGGREIRHLHQHAEQFFYVLSGYATLEVNGETHQLNAQQGLHVPSNTPHQLSNLGEVDLHFIVTSSPPSHGDRVIINASATEA